MSYIFLCFVLLCIVPASVHAELNAKQRAELYLDEYVKGLGASLIDGKWVVTRKESAMGDRTTLTVSLLRDGGAQEFDGSLFEMLCRDNEIGVGFGFFGKNMGHGVKTFEYKIDDQPIKKENWLAVGVGLGSLDPFAFLKSLVGKKRLVVRAYPVTGGSAEMIFDIEGIERILPLIQNECGWK